MLILKIGCWLLATVLSAVAYRCGGMAKNPDTKPKWIPMWLRQSWVRDWLIPLFTYGSLLLWWQPDAWYGYLILLVVYGLTGGALSTYWDFAFKGVDNFYMHGAMIAMACLPLCLVGLELHWALLRIIVLGLAMGLWCKYNDNDVIEEMGRGAFIVLTIPLLLL